MPKDREEILKELKDTYNEGKEKKAIISKSNDLLSNLFAEGVKVKNVKGEGEIEFKNCDDAKGFLNDLKRSGDYPLEEAGREKAYEQHIYFYLYSKGIKPDELAEFMIDPESEAGKKVQDKVKETRQEYFDMIVEKDIKKIGKMYIDGFKNLEDYDVNWLKDVTDAKKINDHLQDFTVLSGVQTYLIQTNRQAAEMRPIDVEVTKEIGEQAANAGININEISSGLSLIQTEAQDIETVFSRRNATDSDGELIRYSAICQMNKTLPDGDITIKNLNVSDFKKEHISGEILSSYVAGLSYLSEDDLPEEYRHDIVAFLNGEKDAVPPYHVFEVEGGEDWPLKLGSYIKRGAIKGDAEIVDYEYVVDPKKWKESVEFDFDNSILMNPANVIRCTEYAKKGELSKLTGNKDEDKNFLEALDGNLENWDKLSKVSQAAVSSSLALKKPELFIGNADEMYEKAKNASIDIDNPAYLKAAEGMKFFSRKGFAANLDSVMDKLSRDKLEKSLDSMEIDKKKEIA
ncbi:MAG: hypothetical protein K6F97_07530, partial [Lachnospiraceae bacterium]|nr:hypothetical protein [Lachnospiraceae bacterium]